MFRFTPHRQPQTRRAESLRCHSALCRAGPRRSRGFSSSVAAAEFPPTAPRPFGLVSVHGSNPSASTPSLKPLPPARLTRPKRVAVPHRFDHPCQSRKDRNLSPRPPSVRLLPRLSACLLTLRKTERTMLSHRPFRLPTSRAVDIRTLQYLCIMELHLTPGANRRIH